jgi:hypothetical protein
MRKPARDIIVCSDEHLVALAWSLACVQLTLNIRIWAFASGKIKDGGLSQGRTSRPKTIQDFQQLALETKRMRIGVDRTDSARVPDTQFTVLEENG